VILATITRRNVLFKKVFFGKFVIIIFVLEGLKKTEDPLNVEEMIRLKGDENYQKKRYLA
jgi:hypothetical protein